MSSSIPQPSSGAPGSTELELTVFGPGVGECLVLHLGNNNWVVIDSCLDPTDSQPAALKYLRSIGVDPATSVRIILATHWHDDHIQGLSKLLEECRSAKFAMSAALASQQFIQLVLEVDAANRLIEHNSSASELRAVFDVLKSRSTGPYAVGPDVYAQDGSRLYQGVIGCEPTELWALSPSTATVTNSLISVADKLLTDEPSRRFKRFTPNDLSVAVYVRCGEFSLLLGADLETTSSAHFGWKAVLNSSNCPTKQSKVFKIAHHGSENADHDEVWKRLLVSNPVAIVTPFAKLKYPLPTAIDIQRIKSATNSVYCTTWPATTSPPRRHGVDGIVRSATKSRRACRVTGGSVRLRVDVASTSALPQLDLSGDAKQL